MRTPIFVFSDCRLLPITIVTLGRGKQASGLTDGRGLGIVGKSQTMKHPLSRTWIQEAVFSFHISLD